MIWFFFTYLHLDNTTGMTHLKIVFLSEDIEMSHNSM